MLETFVNGMSCSFRCKRKIEMEATTEYVNSVKLL